MVSEIRTNAYSEVATAIETISKDNLVKARVGKKDCYLYKTSVVDDSGMPVWVEIALTVKSNEATKTHDSFDAEACIAEYGNHQQELADKPVKAKGGKTPNAEVEARKQARLACLRDWVATKAVNGKTYTATEIYSDVEDNEPLVNVMLTATAAKALVAEGLFDLSVEDGKTVYTVR